MSEKSSALVAEVDPQDPAVEETHQPPEEVTEAVFERPDRGRAAWLVPITLVVLVIASTAFASCLFFFQYLPDRMTDDAAARGVLSAASDSTVAILSYAPDSLDKDFSNAKSRLTGDFLDYYGKFTEQIVGPAAKQKGVKTTASIAQAAVSEIRPDSAVVLVFVNQTTQSAQRPDPSITASSVLVSLKKIDGAWLVSAFNPI